MKINYFIVIILNNHSQKFMKNIFFFKYFLNELQFEIEIKGRSTKKKWKLAQKTIFFKLLKLKDP